MHLQWPITRKKSLQTGVVSGPAAIQALESALEPLSKATNRYDAYREFLRMDPEANNAINRLALLVQFAFKGCTVATGGKQSEEEIQLQKQADAEIEALDFRSRFFYIARHLLRDGDEVFVVHYEKEGESKGIAQIQPLPISKLTALENLEQKSDTMAQIFHPEVWLLSEGTDKEQIFPANDNQVVYQISFSNEAEEIYDLKNRYTFGVWSESPLESLKSRILWKQAILITDILWRYRNVPREVHEVDTSHIKLEQFSGDTVDQRMQAYQTAIQTYLRDYAKEIQKKKVDQGYVVTKGTKIYYTEPKRVAYTSPNDIIEQQNESIREGLGWYKIGRGTFATELVTASYIVLLPDLLAYKIKKVLLRCLREHLRLKYNYSMDLLDKLDLKIQLVLDILRGEIVRQIAVLSASKTHTKDELRKKVGDEPLTEEQRKEIASYEESSQHIQSALDIAATARRQIEPSDEITPESRREKQST